jgi:hypothetical protein
LKKREPIEPVQSIRTGPLPGRKIIENKKNIPEEKGFPDICKK